MFAKRASAKEAQEGGQLLMRIDNNPNALIVAGVVLYVLLGSCAVWLYVK